MSFSIPCLLLGLVGLYLPATRGYPEVTTQGAVLEGKSRTAGGHLPLMAPRVLGWRVERIPPSLLHVPGPRTELRAGRPRKESGQEQHKGAEHGATCGEGLGEKDGDSLHCSREVLKTALQWGARQGAVKSLESSTAPLNPSPSYAWSPLYARSPWQRRLGGLSSTPNTLPHPKCHSALYGGSSPPEEPKPRARSLAHPQNRAASGRARKAGSQPAVSAPAHSSPLPAATQPAPTPRGTFASRGRGSVLPALAPSPMEPVPDANAQSWQQAGPSASKSCPHPMGAAEPRVPGPRCPLARAHRAPSGTGQSEPCPCTQRTCRRGCSRLPALLAGLAQGQK